MRYRPSLALGLAVLAAGAAHGGVKPHCRDLTFAGAAGAASNDKVTLRVVDAGGTILDESCQLQVQASETARHFAARLAGAWGSGTGSGCIEPNPLPTKTCGTGVGGKSCQHKYKFKPDTTTVDPDDGLIRIRICCKEAAGCSGLKLGNVPVSAQTKIDPAVVFGPTVPPPAGITITPVALDPIGMTQQPHRALGGCRKLLGVQTASGFSGVMKTTVLCLDAVAAGAPPGSCTPPPSDEKLASALAGERTRIADAATTSCAPSGAPPADYGYAECPAPCGPVAISAWSDVAACISCLGEAAVQAATGLAYGPTGPPAGSPPEALACQQEIGRGLVGLASTVLTETRKCEEGSDGGKLAVPAGLDCRTADLRGRKALAVDAAAQRIASGCPTPLAFQGLQTCGSDVASVTACVTAAGFQLADDIARAVWPELRGAGSPSGAFLDGER